MLGKIFIAWFSLCLFTFAETQIIIDGLSNGNPRVLLDAMEGKLTHIRAKPATAWRADDAAFLLRQVLITQGYRDVEVRPEVISPQKIRLVVNQGLRLIYGETTIQGIDDSEQEKLLTKLFRAPAQKKRNQWDSALPFREEDLSTGLDYVLRQLKSEGYWDAVVLLEDRQLDKQTGEVKVVIRVNRGPICSIAKGKIEINEGGDPSFALKAMRDHLGETATTAQLDAMRKDIVDAYLRNGFSGTEVFMSRGEKLGFFEANFRVVIGKRMKLRNVMISELQRTRRSRLLDRFKSLKGDWYDETQINQRLRSFLATGAFSSTKVTTQEVEDGVLDATLHFEETDAKEISLAAGVGSYQGFITRAYYTDRNFMGYLLGLHAGFELGSRGLLGEVGLTDPWFLNYDLSASARAFTLFYLRDGYQALEAGFDAKLGWSWNEHHQFELLAGYSIVDASADGIPPELIGENQYLNPKIRLTHAIDYRDSKVLPKSGWHIENALELGAAMGEISAGYLKANFKGGWYHELNKQSRIGIGGEFAALVPTGDAEVFPIDLRLFNGGPRSVRSFPERELGPLSDGDYPLGGQAMWNMNFEYIRNVAGPLAAVAFIDAGSLAGSWDTIGESELEMAAGLGLRLDLPIGPVRLEYGVNLTRDDGEPSGTLHFAIGFAY